MNVTRFNYKELFPFIEKCLKKSNYIAIDFEMSGTLKAPQFRNSNLDDLQTRYFKAAENVRAFQVLQMGICGFDTISEANSIKAYPFNFYILPYWTDTTIKTFETQMSTLHFLSSHNFDFNRLYQEGIYFSSKTEEDAIKTSKNSQKHKKQLREDISAKSVDTKAFMDYNLPLAKKFLSQSKSSDETLKISIEFMKPRIYKFFITH
jgi:hypothetical protein